MILFWAMSFGLAGEPLVTEGFEAAKARHLRVQSVSMGVLASWSVVNLGVGGVGAVIAESPRQEGFWAGNAGWNLVNLGIATSGLASVGAKRTSITTGPQLLKAQNNLERALLVNIGLDVAYMMAGLAVRERGLRVEDPRLQGFGDALLVQGGFLFVFDIGAFAASRRSRRRDVYQPFSSTRP
ncbi:MAG: hypothetical protein AAGA48_06245 [Myxococcota bacterium]